MGLVGKLYYHLWVESFRDLNLGDDALSHLNEAMPTMENKGKCICDSERWKKPRTIIG